MRIDCPHLQDCYKRGLCTLLGSNVFQGDSMNQLSASLDQQALEHRLEEVPEGILPHIRMGYRLLAQASPEQRQRFLSAMLEAVESRRSIDVAGVSDLLGLTDKIAGDALAAVSLSMGAVVDLDVNEDDFVRYGLGTIFDETEASIAREIVSGVIQRRERLRSAVDSSSLANAVLPVFQNLSYQIDIRLSFDKEGAVSRSVPVAVMYISTDCDPDLWLQATKDDIQRLIERLQKASSELEKAATLSLGASA